MTQSLWLVISGILGLIVGSFLNVLIHRLPLMMFARWQHDYQQWQQQRNSTTLSEAPSPATSFNLMRPGSHCPHCKHKLTVWENIPVISFMLLKGRCRVCHSSIAWRYPLVEGLTAILSVLTVAHFGITFISLLALIFTWGLIALAAIDFEQQILPDEITIPLLWLGLICNIKHAFTDLTSAILGAVVGYLFLWLVFWLFKLLTKKEGIGQGDFKLLAMLGAWLGWQALPGIILFSSLAGTVVGISLILTKRLSRSTPIPFGPFLAIAGWISLIWGKSVTSLYLSLFAL